MDTYENDSILKFLDSTIASELTLGNPGPRVGPPCKDGCFERLGDAVIQEVFHKFWLLRDLHHQNRYLRKLMIRVPLKVKENSRIKKKHTYKIICEDREFSVCLLAFQSIHGISNRRVRKAQVVNVHTKSNENKVKASKNPLKALTVNNIERVKEHIELLPTTVFPSTNEVCLPSGYSPQTLYSKYKEWLVSEHPQEHPVTEDSYTFIFNKEFNINFWPPDDSLDNCDSNTSHLNNSEECETKCVTNNLISSDAEVVEMNIEPDVYFEEDSRNNDSTDDVEDPSTLMHFEQVLCTKGHICQICNHSLSRSDHLRYHIKKKHENFLGFLAEKNGSNIEDQLELVQQCHLKRTRVDYLDEFEMIDSFMLWNGTPLDMIRGDLINRDVKYENPMSSYSHFIDGCNDNDNTNVVNKGKNDESNLQSNDKKKVIIKVCCKEKANLNCSPVLNGEECTSVDPCNNISEDVNTLDETGDSKSSFSDHNIFRKKLQEQLEENSILFKDFQKSQQWKDQFADDAKLSMLPKVQLNELIHEIKIHTKYSKDTILLDAVYIMRDPKQLGRYKILKCQICGDISTRSDHLRKHLKLKHIDFLKFMAKKNKTMCEKELRIVQIAHLKGIIMEEIKAFKEGKMDFTCVTEDKLRNTLDDEKSNDEDDIKNSAQDVDIKENSDYHLKKQNGENRNKKLVFKFSKKVSSISGEEWNMNFCEIPNDHSTSIKNKIARQSRTKTVHNEEGDYEEKLIKKEVNGLRTKNYDRLEFEFDEKSKSLPHDPEDVSQLKLERSEDLELSIYNKMLLTYVLNQMTKLRRKKRTKLMRCLECKFNTACKRLMAKHFRRVHVNSYRFTCSDCGYSTVLKDNLELHIMSVHLHIPLKCKKCNYSTYDRKNLKKHTRSSHWTSDSVYSCKYCSQIHKSKEKLTMHINSQHSYERPFACEYCSYRSSYKADLRKHTKRSHHNMQFFCVHCSYMTSTQSSLENHNYISHY